MNRAKQAAGLLAISFVEVMVGFFLFLLPGGWEVVKYAESALFYTALMPRSYLVVAFVAAVNVALYRGNIRYPGAN